MTRGWIWETLKVCDNKYFFTDLKYLYVYFRGCHGLWMSGKFEIFSRWGKSLGKLYFLPNLMKSQPWNFIFRLSATSQMLWKYEEILILKLSLIPQIAEEQKDRNVTGNTEIYLTFLQLIRAIPRKNAGLSNLISELTQEDSKGKRNANLVWQAWQWLFWKKLHLSLNKCFCKEIESSNIKRKSRQHTQVITLSRLSHKRLPSSSFSLPVA